MSKNSVGCDLVDELDASHFKSVEAVERYLQLKKKEIIRERGITVFPEDVASLGWGYFATKSPYINETVVREFYANMREYINNVVCLHGKVVMIHKELIYNRFGMNEDAIILYATPKISNLKHYVYGLYDKCLYEGSEVIRTEDKKILYHVCDLLPKYKTWYHYVSSRLIPNTTDEKVTKDCACILYIIARGGILIPEKIIRERMLRFVDEMEKNDIPFGGLITKLCDIIGVGTAISDSILPPFEDISEMDLVDYSHVKSKHVDAKFYAEIASLKKRKCNDKANIEDLRYKIE